MSSPCALFVLPRLYHMEKPPIAPGPGPVAQNPPQNPAANEISAAPAPKHESARDLAHEQPDEPPGYHGLIHREVVLCNGLFDTNLKAFASYESYRMFKDFSKPWKSSEQFQRAKYNQNLTKGLPLIVSKRVFNWGFGEVRYMKLYDVRTSPESPDRLYTKCDNRFMALVMKKRFLRYTRFRLIVADSEVVIFYHHLLQIMDFKHDDKRFRFIKTDLNRVNLNHFAYDLVSLKDGQPSLVDELTTSKKIAHSNVLLGSRIGYTFGFRPKSVKGHDLLSPRLWGKLQLCKRDALFTRTSRTCSFCLFNPVPVDLNMNSSVDATTHILTAVSLVLKSFELDLMVQNAPVHPPFSTGGTQAVYATL